VRWTVTGGHTYSSQIALNWKAQDEMRIIDGSSEERDFSVYDYMAGAIAVLLHDRFVALRWIQRLAHENEQGQ
jgi:hypothetical protein